MKIIFTLLALLSFSFASDAFLHNYQKALEVAQTEKKEIYMLVTSESCRWCRKFENETLTDEATMKMLKENFVLLALTRDVDYIPENLVASRVPKHFFLTKKGEIITSFLGFWNPEDFASFIEDVKKKIKAENE